MIAPPPRAGATGISSLDVHYECGARVVCVDAVKGVQSLDDTTFLRIRIQRRFLLADGMNNTAKRPLMPFQ